MSRSTGPFRPRSRRAESRGIRIALSSPRGISVDDVVKELILRTLKHTDATKTEAAKKLGLSPKTIRTKLQNWKSEEEGAGN